MAKENDPLIDALIAAATGGVDSVGVTEVKGRLMVSPLATADAAARLRAADDDEVAVAAAGVVVPGYARPA